MATIKVLDIASAEIGYLEKANAKDLDSKTANAGDKNYTKYARDIDAIPNYFNGRKQGYSWCATFVNWCLVQAYGANIAKKMTYQPSKSLGASCSYAIGYYKKAGRFFTKNPQPGDQIFFSQGHTGLVERIEGGKLYTIEGNTSGASGVVPNGGGVCRKSYALNDAKITGYGRPDYSLTKSEAEEAIDWITGKGIMLGNTSGDLMLDQPITRKQFAVMLYRYDSKK